MKKSKTSIQTQNKVLAIDPGFDRIGVAVVSKDDSKEKLIFSKCILTNKKEIHSRRLEQIGLEIKEVIKKHKPDFLAIEKLFFNQNTTSALKVAEARGVIMYEAELAGLEICEYSPQEIKIAVTGYGKAGKNEVESMTLRLLSMKTAPKFDDEMDAIAIGICHLASFRHKKLLSTD
jgi:crossover junction endodeoxyribonuclease RuvC